MLAGSFGQLCAAQHAGYFLGALLAGDRTDAGTGTAREVLFLDHIMVIGEGCDLREMSHAEYLIGACQCFQFLADGLRGAASNAGVDFVEDHGTLPARNAASSCLLRRRCPSRSWSLA